jgi:hypothetical protein
MSSPESLQTNKNYTYNPSTQKYIFHTEKKFGKNLVFTKISIDLITKLYSNLGSALTSNEIALKLGLPLETIKHVLRIMNITHDSLPFSEETISVTDEDSLVEDAMSSKRFNVLQKIEKRDWKETQEDAEKWRAFKTLHVDPFSGFMEKWSPPKLAPMPKSVKLSNKSSDKVFVAVLSDLHFGSSANSRYMFGKNNWSTADTVKAVDNYANEITKEVDDRNFKFKRCVIIGMGDLIHSVLGKTARGTELKYDVVREEQFEYALNSLLIFISRMTELFGFVECHDVGGNHHYELDMALFKALDMYFKHDKRISFQHYSTRPAAFKIDKTLIMMDHGADSIERVYVPSGSKLEKHVNNILLNNSHLLDGVNTKLFLQGDKHHFEHLEFASFEYIMFGTILGSDEHASTNNWHNRARQSCLILDDRGLREIIHIYSDQ